MSKRRLNALYFKIGEEKKLGEILQDFYKRMSNDVLIGFFFTGKDIQAIASKQKELLLFVMGIQPHFKGKHPSVAHLELPPLLKGHFDRRLVILKETLRDHGLGEKDIRTWIEFENAFRNVLVEEESIKKQ